MSLQATVDGEVSTADFPRLNDAVQLAFGLPAMPSHLGQSLQWSYVDSQRGRSVLASVTVRDGRTHIRLNEASAG